MAWLLVHRLLIEEPGCVDVQAVPAQLHTVSTSAIFSHKIETRATASSGQPGSRCWRDL